MRRDLFHNVGHREIRPTSQVLAWRSRCGTERTYISGSPVAFPSTELRPDIQRASRWPRPGRSNLDADSDEGFRVWTSRQIPSRSAPLNYVRVSSASLCKCKGNPQLDRAVIDGVPAVIRAWIIVPRYDSTPTLS